MADLKKPLSYEEQLERLKSFHKLTIEDDDAAIDILKRVNYYRLSAYGIGLKKPENNDEYIADVSINNLYQLYLFDSALRNKLLHIIEHIEIHLRTQIANLLALKYDAIGYMDPHYFSSKTDGNGNSIHQLIIQSFQDEITRQQNLPFVKHHLQKYEGRFPIWAAIELFSFGKLSSLYSIMQNKDRKELADRYSISPDHLQGWIMSLLEIRNLCAHYNRVYNLILKHIPYYDLKYKRYIAQGGRRTAKIFLILLVIKHMTEPFNPALWQEFIEDFKKLIQNSRANPIFRLSFLGLPHGWEQALDEPINTKNPA